MDLGTKWGGGGSHEPELVRAERTDPIAAPFSLAHELAGRLLEDDGSKSSIAQYVGAIRSAMERTAGQSKVPGDLRNDENTDGK